MKNLRFTKIIASLLVVISLIKLNPVSAATNTYWKKDNKGWRYGEGYYHRTGWNLIDGDWYYFYTGYDGYSTESMREYMAHDTTIQGYYVGSDGKWVNNPIFVVKDPNLRQVIKDKVGRQYGDFTKDEVKSINTLILENKNISTLFGLNNLTNLKVLIIRDNQLSDISALKNMPWLTVVHIESSKLTDVATIVDTLKCLPNVKTVALKENQFTKADEQKIADVLPVCDLTFYY